MPSLLTMQWLIVGFFVLIHFLLGMIRGTAKSAWFLLAYVVTATLTFLLIANFTLTWFFSTQESMVGIITWANGLAGGLLTPYMDYLTDPAITPVIFMILDLVIKIVLYSVLFPVVRFLLAIIIFKPIWKRIFLKKMLEAQNEKLEMAHEESNSDKKFKKKKKLKVNFLSRLSGGLIGAVRGFLVAFVFLLPILVFASFVGKIDTTALTGGVSTSGTVELAAGDPGDPFGLAEYATYLNQVKEMNEKGLGQLTNMIVINEKSFDRYVFDSMFTPIINDGAAEKATVNFIQELENIIDVASIIVNNGYMDRNFNDLSTITDDDVANAQLIIQIVGRSDLLSYMLSSGLDKAPDIIPQLITDGPLADIDWESESLQATLQYLVDTDWHEEFNRIAALVGALNDFMSPAEIVDLMATPGDLANLDSDQILALTDVIRAVGDLHLLAGINLGIEYAITLPDVQANIAWVTDPEVYLKDKLSFILDNPEFFIGESGEISKIADLMDTILTDDTADLEAILNSGGDLQIIMANQSEELVTAIFTQLADMDLLVNGLPIGVDFALYSLGGDAIADELAGDLAMALSDIDWSAEITNVGDIYAEAVSLSLENLFAEDPDMLAYADLIIQNADNMSSVRAIVSHIFEDSELVGNALDAAAPYIIEQMITDEQLKEIVQGVVLDANDDFDFNIGQEINSILTIAEQVSTFTTFSQIGGFGELDLDGKLELIADFGGMPQTNYANFRTALTSLQFFSKIDENVAADLVDYLQLTDTVYIPTDMLFSDDIGAIIDLGRDVAHYFYTESIAYSSYEDIDVTDLLDTIKTDLLDSAERSDLLFYNVVFQAQKMADEGSLSEFLTIPQSLLDAGVEDPVWDAEMNALLGAVFDIATSIGEVDGVTLSVKEIQTYAGAASELPIAVITQYADLTTVTDAFGGLDASLILRASIPALIDSQGEAISDSLFGHILMTPTHLVDENDLLDVGVFTDLIYGFATLLDDMNNTLGYIKIGDLSGNDIGDFMLAFSQIDDASIQAFAGSDLIHGIISDLITDPVFQQGLADTLNEGQDTITIDASLFAVDPVLLDPAFTTKDVLLPDEVANILLMLKAAQFTDLEFTNVGLETFTGMFGRNVDEVTGEDDFDRFLSSGYIYSVIDGILQMPEISTMVSDQLESTLGPTTLDFTLPDEMLGQQADADADLIDPIEVGRLPKAEFRKIFNSISLVDMNNLGINTFTDLVSPVQSPDDFTTFIDSDFIYFILATLFDNQGFGDYIGEQLGSQFGDSLTLNVSVPTDAKGTQAEADADTIAAVEVGRIKRTELRSLMISFSMIDLENFDIPAMLNLFNTTYYVHEDPDPLEDRDNDFYQFVDSKFLQAMVSQILLSDAIIETIAGTGTANELFVSTDFNMPAPGLMDTQPDGYDRMTKDEIFYVFNGLAALGVTDFENVDLGLDAIKSIDDEQLLKANYLYAVLDLAIAGQASLTVPIDAKETSGDYNGMIIKDEIHKLFVAINTLPTDFNLDEFNVGSITQADILAIIDVESLLINQMVSDQIAVNLETIITIDKDILPDAYETTTGVNRLYADELRALVSALTPLGITDLSEAPDTTAIKIATLVELHSLGLGTAAPDDYDSYLIQYLISDQIADYLATPTNAIYPTTGTGVIVNPAEITKLISALTIIADDNDPLTDDTQTLLSEVATVQSSDLTREKIGSLLDLESLIIDRMVAENIIGMTPSIMVDNAYAVDGDPNYDPNAINSDIKREEMRAIVAVLDDEVLDITSLADPIATDNVTIGQLQALHDLGMGTGLVGTELYNYDSYIIHHLISQSISDVLTTPQFAIPYASVDHADLSADYYLIADEIQAIIDTLLLVAADEPVPEDATLAVISGDINAKLTPAKIKTMLDYDKRITDRLIASGIITASGTLFALDDAYLVDGEPNYEAAQLDIKRDEMYAVVAALGNEVLQLGSLNELSNFDTVSIGQLQSLHDLGMGSGLVGIDNLDYDSYILHNIISKSLRDVLEVTFDLPTSAIDNADPYYLVADEIQGVLDSLLLIQDGDTNAVLTDMTGNINSKLTPAKLETMLNYDKRIVDRMIGSGIMTASSGGTLFALDDAYLVDGEPNYDGLQLDLKRDEMFALAVAMGDDVLGLANLGDLGNFDGATIAELQLLHNLGMGSGLVAGTYDYDSYILNNIISKSIRDVLELTFDIPALAIDNASPYYLVADEIQAVINSMVQITGGDTANLTSIGTAITSGGFGRTQIETILGYDKRITDRMIANGMITANQDVPEAYILLGELNYEAANLDLKHDEMLAMTAAMDVLSIDDLTDPGQFNSNSIGPDELDTLNALGLDVPVGNVYDSYMVQNLLTTGVSALSPSAQSLDAYGYIQAREIEHLAETLRILNINDITELSGLNSGSSNFTGLTNTEIDYIAEDGAASPHYLVYEFLASVFGSGSRAQLKAALILLQ